MVAETATIPHVWFISNENMCVLGQSGLPNSALAKIHRPYVFTVQAVLLSPVSGPYQQPLGIIRIARQDETLLKILESPLNLGPNIYIRAR